MLKQFTQTRHKTVYNFDYVCCIIQKRKDFRQALWCASNVAAGLDIPANKFTPPLGPTKGLAERRIITF